ncbi:MAG TPA: hypothetical protein VGR64_04240 [Terracidiphilus sp.]|nr:hypothetical protein [Terracidiphilus sp.]
MTFTHLHQIVTFLSGARDTVPAPLRGPLGLALRCFAWAFLLLLIYAFCGQTNNFIYVIF